MDARSRLLALAFGAVVAGFSAYLLTVGDLTRSIPSFLVAYGVAFVAYAGAVMLFRRLTPSRETLVWIAAVAVAARVVGILATPTLSDDINRYLWEGRVLRDGVNPFAVAPEDPRLEHLRDDYYEGINHKDMETIYPPLAQAVFLVGAAVSPTLTGQKVMFGLFDVATLVLLWFLLRRLGRNPNLSVIYGWSPLVIVEFSHSGHMDAVGIFFLVLAVYWLAAERRIAGVTALGLSFLAKYLALLAVPYFVFKRRRAPWLGLFAAVAIVGYIPFASASTKLVSSLGVYSQHWQFNGFVYSFLVSIVRDGLVVRYLLAGAIAAVALYQGYRRNDIGHYLFVVVGTALLLTPTLYPWYLCWMVPFLCIRPNAAWLLLTGTAVLSYMVWTGYHATGVWQLAPAVMVAEYIPFYALLIYLYRRTRVSKS